MAMYPEWTKHILLPGMKREDVVHEKSKYVNTSQKDIREELKEYNDNSMMYNKNRTKWLRNLQRGWENVLFE